jgi:ferrous iron transport protein A
LRALIELAVNETAIILNFSDSEIALKLLELGCLPGASIQLLNKAPMGDPYAFLIDGSIITMRKKEAATVMIQSK